jgi:hypothetical protein
MWEQQHEIGAEKMYSLCSELGGLFLKVHAAFCSVFPLRSVSLLSSARPDEFSNLSSTETNSRHSSPAILTHFHPFLSRQLKFWASPIWRRWPG